MIFYYVLSIGSPAMSDFTVDFLIVWGVVFGGLFALATLEQIGLLIGRAWRYLNG